jgi:hypothetical protein
LQPLQLLCLSQNYCADSHDQLLWQTAGIGAYNFLWAKFKKFDWPESYSAHLKSEGVIL